MLNSANIFTGKIFWHGTFIFIMWNCAALHDQLKVQIFAKFTSMLHFILLDAKVVNKLVKNVY